MQIQDCLLDHVVISTRVILLDERSGSAEYDDDNDDNEDDDEDRVGTSKALFRR